MPATRGCWLGRYKLGLKQVLEYSDSGRCQMSTRYFRATRVLALQCNRLTSNNDGRKLCCKIACGGYLMLISRPSLSLFLCSTYLQYLGPTYFMSTHILMYFIMLSHTKYTKNLLVGSPAVLVRDKIHCNKYPGARRVMSVGYPGSKISTRFNPSTNPTGSEFHWQYWWCIWPCMHNLWLACWGI